MPFIKTDQNNVTFHKEGEQKSPIINQVSNVFFEVIVPEIKI